jgi:hypothetical protein
MTRRLRLAMLLVTADAAQSSITDLGASAADDRSAAVPTW